MRCALCVHPIRAQGDGSATSPAGVGLSPADAVSQSPQGGTPRDPGLLRGVGPTSADLGRREASPAMCWDDAAGRGRSRCVARRRHFRHLMHPADLAPIWSRMPRRRCCGGPAPRRPSPTCVVTSNGRRMAARPQSSQQPRGTTPYVVHEAGGLVAGPGEDGFVGK